MSLQKIRNWMDRHPGVTAGIALLCMTGGVLSFWQPWRPSPPDANNESLAKVAAFLGTERFAAMPSDEREAYISALSRRYLTATASDRALIDRELSPGSTAMRPLQRQLGLAMLRKSLDGYQNLSADERASRLAALKAFAAAMGFRSGAAAPLAPGAPDPVAAAAGTQDGFRQGLERFKRDLLDGGLNAQERAALGGMAEELRPKRQ